ncbi:AAA+ ATPase domain-containing protein [Vibrio crassostreae]|uniref:AAA+ ATPase domain-containing protein n=1 Tax=Vibrio crassostreae TaxID=246167 RepID=A0ABP1WT26_9VIBR|nr:AAA family ATPase [Vibrio crassostreae]ROO49556.1 AAA domain-containing protein [Vibrio crassostreae]TCL22148.1 AAA domain-containing protein [Vibrio crassostreae]TCN97842.1 AAA domain-containing protein [Vibrio crassostreae]TCT44852.1 AAA domain-containing protein [Vibrio crassostreae]TCT47379.1 AAA domain-containing protein [Vibrio crassostreae]
MITQSLDSLMSSPASQNLSFSLKGLLKGHVGMLIAAPNVGKSHLALCIAMEHASSMYLLGMSAADKPAKTLVLSSEDGAGVIQSRMKEKLVNCTATIKSELKNNLHFLTDIEPIVIPPDSSVQEQTVHKQYLEQLKQTFSEFDLVIVDTVTESIGRCEEVKHDRLIKNVFQSLANESGASLLLVHHVNKDEIRGNQEITMASGAGLTSIMRLTKCLFTLKRNKDSLSIKYLKSNYLPENENQEFMVEVRQNLTINPQVFSLKSKGSKLARSAQSIKQNPKKITLPGTIPEQEEIEERKNLRDVL